MFLYVDDLVGKGISIAPYTNSMDNYVTAKGSTVHRNENIDNYHYREAIVAYLFVGDCYSRRITASTDRE